MSVLLIEPEKALAKRIKNELEKAKFLVTCCSCSQEEAGTRAGRLFDFVMVSLDYQDRLGDTIIQRIRKTSRDCKIVAIGSQHISIVQESLWLGADDYFEKKSLDELTIRIRLLKRRISPYILQMTFTHGEFIFQEEQSLLIYQEMRIELTNIERRILLELFMTKTTVKINYLIDKIWGDRIFDGANRLMKRVSVLRKKIKKISPKPLIKTIKGVGYSLD
ncbi:winged helix-turn-helix domain-containing protein [bacterium]|nr:winged helix-turn-helix domain-containing protein [bacterium]